MRRRFDAIADRIAVFGTCRRCTRLSGLAAAGLAILAASAVALLGPRSPIAGLALVAAALSCVLYAAHRIAAGRRRSPVIRLLKVFGADARETRSIMGAFPDTPGFAALRAGRLRPGETLEVTREPNPEGVRISRVVVKAGEQVLTEVVRRDDGLFAPVEVVAAGP